MRVPVLHPGTKTPMPAKDRLPPPSPHDDRMRAHALGELFGGHRPVMVCHVEQAVQDGREAGAAWQGTLMVT